MSKSPRDAISRAEFFLSLAKECPVNQRDHFEAFLEASIVYARAALHRLQKRYENHPAWRSWWKSLLEDPSVKFFRIERNWILKEGPPKINQIIRFGEPVVHASELYYYEEPSISAVETITKHLEHIKNVFAEAERGFLSEQLG